MKKSTLKRKFKEKTKERVEKETVIIIYSLIILLMGVYIMFKSGYAEPLLNLIGIN